MEINIDPTIIRTHQPSIDELIKRIASGKAILFTGAGFSKGSKGVSQEALPDSKELAKRICQLGGFDAQGAVSGLAI